MRAAVDRKRQPRRAAAAGQAARAVSRRGASALEITPGLPGRLQVGMQPLGQPGAARPDAHQRACRACNRRAHAGQQLGVQRFGVEVAACSWLVDWLQELFEDQRRGGRVDIAGARAAIASTVV